MKEKQSEKFTIAEKNELRLKVEEPIDRVEKILTARMRDQHTSREIFRSWLPTQLVQPLAEQTAAGLPSRATTDEGSNCARVCAVRSEVNNSE